MTEKFFYNKGVRGTAVYHENEILVVAYTDDLAVFADSQSDLRRKISRLEEYFKANKMKVNKEKSKILIFQGGRPKKDLSFKCEKVPLEIVSTFSYLGVTFSSSAMSLQAFLQVKTFVNMSIATILRTISAFKLDNWYTKETLFQSLARSVLFKGIETWGLKYLDENDRIQTSFYKRLLDIPKKVQIMQLNTDHS